MKLLLKRIALKPTYTIGWLYINGQKVCDTIEDAVRDLNKNGCILVGENKEVGKVLNSTATFRRVYAMLKAASDRGEPIQIEIV